MDELMELSEYLPPQVRDDIRNRLIDWMSAGGGNNDSYVRQQLRYAKNYINKFGVFDDGL